VTLYALEDSPKFEPAARRWLVRYLTERTLSWETSPGSLQTLAPRED
jgi:hypothetical protein